MRAHQSVFGVLISFLLVTGWMLPSHIVGVVAQDSQGYAGFVSGTSRVIALQTEHISGDSKYGLGAGDWIVVILDITNFNNVPLQTSVGEFSLAPSESKDPIKSDSSQSPSVELGYTAVQSDGSLAIPVDTTVRAALAFPLADTKLAGLAPLLQYQDQTVSISTTLVDSLNPDNLPAVQHWSGSQGTVQTVLGGGELEISVGGTTQTVAMAGVETPPSDGCFGPESAAAVTALSGGNVWVEDDPTSNGSLVWYWDGAAGHLKLLNSVLIEQGFAGYQEDDASSAYASWLQSSADVAEKSKTGLWELCRDASGRWIKKPAPTPVPTKTADEVRAEYQWVDVRDLTIRSDNYIGEKIALSGSVFNIPPGQSGSELTVQIEVQTPVGGTEVVLVVLDGDTSGIYEGTWLTVYGTGAGSYTFTNALGGQVSQPLVFADFFDR